LYFEYVTQFVEVTKMHTLHMNKKEIWCACKNCENNVSWTMTETIHENLLEKGFVDNYSVWTKHGETGENAEGNDTEQEREEASNDDSTHVFDDSHGGEGIDVEELLRNIEHEVLIENRKGGLDNLEMMEKALKELLYEESKGFNKECTILQTVLDLLTLKARNGWSGTGFNLLLQLLENLIPKLNSLPTITNHAKKIFSPLTLG
jgi:uncharacterized protein YqgQ/transcription elongation factor Elf1